MQVWSAPVAIGVGVVSAAHGLRPAPAPAALGLPAGAEVAGLGPAAETVASTGAALFARCRPAGNNAASRAASRSRLDAASWLILAYSP